MWLYKKPVHCTCVKSCPRDKTNDNFVINKAFDYNQGEKKVSLFFWKLFIFDFFLNLKQQHCP